MPPQKKSPEVGIGVIIVNNSGNILIGKRIGKHAPYYSIPGGWLKRGETFEQAAIREIKEETNLDIVNPKIFAITNNLKTYHKEGIHSISIVLLVKKYSGKLKIMEPQKFENFIWADPKNPPQPHFEASQLGIECYLKKTFYINKK